MKKLFRLGLCLSLVGAWGAEATVLLALDLDTLAQKADMVIRAKVLSAQAKKVGENPGRIMTDIELKSLECWKGTCPEVVTAVVAGGQKGAVEQRLSGSAQFTPGEECVVFLKAHGRHRFRVLGMAQGKYRLERNADLGEPVAVPEEVKDAELIYSDIQRKAMPLRKEMPLSTLRQRVRDKQKSSETRLKTEGRP
jgi:hypothetical protein